MSKGKGPRYTEEGVYDGVGRDADGVFFTATHAALNGAAAVFVDPRVAPSYGAGGPVATLEKIMVERDGGGGWPLEGLPPPMPGRFLNPGNMELRGAYQSAIDTLAEHEQDADAHAGGREPVTIDVCPVCEDAREKIRRIDHALPILEGCDSAVINAALSLFVAGVCEGRSPAWKREHFTREGVAVPGRLNKGRDDRNSARHENRIDAVANVADGMSQKDAANKAGVTVRTLREWLPEKEPQPCPGYPPGERCASGEDGEPALISVPRGGKPARRCPDCTTLNIKLNRKK